MKILFSTCRHGKWICSTLKCKQDCQWNSWKETVPCNVTCGKGIRILERTVLEPSRFGGHECTGIYSVTEIDDIMIMQF